MSSADLSIVESGPGAPTGASFTLAGAGVASGISIGYAHLITSARLEVAQFDIAASEIDAEIKRFDDAVQDVHTEFSEIAEITNAPTELGAFVNLHRMILADSTLSQMPRDLIRARHCNAEWALVQQMEHLVEQFEAIEDPYLRERKADVQQVVERVLKALMRTAHSLNQPTGPVREEDVIVVAHDLSPADMLLFKRRQFAGFVTDVGGVTSHTAIVARSLDLPAIVGLHHARHTVREDDLLIVDGAEGVLIVNPDRQVLAEYQLKQREHVLERQKLKRLKSTPAATIDGTAIELQANIELPQDIEHALEGGATGVGLFRSEFLFLNRRDVPDEEEQFNAYRQVAEAMQGLPVTIRTLDIGADKSPDRGEHRPGPNPALGLRAIRYCLAEPHLFQTQLRAILRASTYGKVRILLPMLAHAHEIDQALAAIAQAKESLTHDGFAYDREIPIGGMIEVPAAAITAGFFAKRLQFLSIGTNDLIQYTLAIDRTDDAVAHLYDPAHPAVLYLVAHTIRTATQAGVPIAVCGEMAGEIEMTRLLLGLGLRQFSMHPAQLLAIKQQVLRTDLAEAQTAATRILRSSDPQKIRQLMDKLND
jgi:phosphoenolpyruvate-protein phosphotransferase (PTS system enzyme I)